MNILIATDKFKGSLSSMEAAMAIKAGFERTGKPVHCVCLPVSDGGEGLREAISAYAPVRKIGLQVCDPLFRPIQTSFLLSADGSTAFIEMASASGLALLKPPEYNCQLTSTYGTGELIRHAIMMGVRSVILGIGGSATNDGGMGMAAALGYRFLDQDGKELQPVGANLIRVASIACNGTGSLHAVDFRVACDVSNPLTGPQGAARIYAPQKGATPEMVEQLEEGMAHFGNVVKQSLGIDVLGVKGGGAAGGLGAGCLAFLNATLVPGMELLFDYCHMDNHIREADLVVTGEGKIDEQTIHGKVVGAVALRAFQHHRPVIAFCGVLDLKREQLAALHIDNVYPIKSKDISVEDAIQQAASLLEAAAFKAAGELRYFAG